MTRSLTPPRLLSILGALAGLAAPATAGAANISIDFNSRVDLFGNSSGVLYFQGTGGFQVIFSADTSNGAYGGLANGIEITNRNYGNAKVGSTTDYVIGANNAVTGGNNYHSSGIVATFNQGATSVSFDDTDDDSTVKALFAFDQAGNLIAQSPFASRTRVTVTAPQGTLIYRVEFDTAAGAAGGSTDGTYFTIDNFIANGVDASTQVDIGFPPSNNDSDADGVLNAADAFPCDATRASVTYFPGQSTSALIGFEDQWPGSTDLDFNDVVVRAHYRLERNAAGNVVTLAAVIDPVALGGDLSSGLGLVLPAPRTGVTARRRVGSGGWSNLALESDASATMVLSPNLRELFANAQGRINSISGQPRVTGERLEVEVTFATPAAISQAAAPFDLFVFRAGNFAHQIHFPQYAGTAAMNAALFNSQEDASTASRRFVHTSGIPAALNLMTTTRYPLEGVRISQLFPDIATFASSGGQQATSFYTSNVVSAQGHDIAAVALPVVGAPSVACLPNSGTSCLAILNAGQTASGVYTIDADGAGPLAAFSAYCDMATDGGGWTLVANQAPDAPLRSVTASDVSAGNFGSLTSSYRLGNARIQAFSPTVGWRMQSVSTAGALRDNVFFRPQCRIDWLRVVGLVGSDVIIANSSILTFTSAPDSAPDVYCNTAYTSSTFGTLISGRTTANGSYGIGQNNSGGYCSIRMSSAAWASSPLSNPEGAAYPCTMSEVSTHHVRLWVK